MGCCRQPNFCWLWVLCLRALITSLFQRASPQPCMLSNDDRHGALGEAWPQRGHPYPALPRREHAGVPGRRGRPPTSPRCGVTTAYLFLSGNRLDSFRFFFSALSFACSIASGIHASHTTTGYRVCAKTKRLVVGSWRVHSYGRELAH